MKSEIRIIGGRWRGRKLAVVDVAGLRPTPDRIRETLFNWLAADCPGATVLDCFAGSGALGFEALSRGAKHLVLLEQDQSALANLRTQAERLQCDAVEILAGDAAALVNRLDHGFDIVFVDPPYARGELRARILLSLEERGLLRPGARIYLEWPAAEDLELPSAQLRWIKRKIAGQVNYAIAEWGC